MVNCTKVMFRETDRRMAGLINKEFTWVTRQCCDLRMNTQVDTDLRRVTRGGRWSKSKDPHP